jgi:hypothetical protein
MHLPNDPFIQSGRMQSQMPIGAQRLTPALVFSQKLPVPLASAGEDSSGLASIPHRGEREGGAKGVALRARRGGSAAPHAENALEQLRRGGPRWTIEESRPALSPAPRRKAMP